ELFIDFEPGASLVKQAYTFGEIRLGLPFGLVWVRPDGSLNLAELGSSSEAQPEGNLSQESESLPPVRIEHFSIQQGMVEFR
ncbi:MAG TPA: hypothetical protein DD706_04905, partial [Nitrospiraceae bacterium]|nr:hypothetical protein [Nitrospiraceae bacterium]